MIYLSVRSSLDWKDERAFWAQLPAHLRAPVEMWNELFRIPYHAFRQELKELSRSNWATLPGVVVAPFEAIPDGELVLPTDDDDWFSPRVGPTLEGARRHGAAVYRWPGRFLEFHPTLRYRLGSLRRHWLPRTPTVEYCSTNGYAIHKGQVEDRLFMNHVRAGRFLLAHPELGRELEHPLSLMNRSLASQTVLAREQPLRRARLLDKYRRCVRLYQRPLAPELAWAAPYVARMADLMDELKPVLRGRRLIREYLAVR